MPADSPNPIVLYDGVCGLCNRTVQFILKRDSRDRFRFATLQSEFARALLQKHGAVADRLESTYLVLHQGLPSERVEACSTSVIGICRELGGVWGAVAMLLRLFPRGLRDWGYDLVARYRYRIFGKFDTCPLPEEKHRHKFLAM
jgi:predicted DCC family thiol-disulfide oxidoreductase YuxK